MTWIDDFPSFIDDVKTRIHPVTGKPQRLVTDLFSKLEPLVPRDSLGLIGISWEDLYPDEESQFALGQASFQQKVAVVSFGRYDPKTYKDPAVDDGDGNQSVDSRLEANMDIAEEEKRSNCDDKQDCDTTSQKMNYGKQRSFVKDNVEEESDDTDKRQCPNQVTYLTGAIVWRLIRCLSHEICHLFYFAHCRYFECAMSNSHSVSDAESKPLFLCPICLRKLQKVCGFDVVARYEKLENFLTYLSSIVESPYLNESVVWIKKMQEFLQSAEDAEASRQGSSLRDCFG